MGKEGWAIMGVIICAMILLFIALRKRSEWLLNFILRGIRYVSDFEYEKAIADMNRSLDGDIESVFLTCLPQYTSVASTLVRDVIRNGGDVSQFVPKPVLNTLKAMQHTII